jgi:CRP-like cAMP-binding protein
VELVRSHPLFGPLPRESLEKLIRTSRVEHLDAGEILYRAGEPADRAHAILQGALQIEYPTPGEVRGMVKVMLPAPGFLGEAHVLHSSMWSGTGVAMSSLISLALTRGTLEGLVLEHPSLALVLYRELAARFLRSLENWKAERVLEPSQLLARYLWSFAEVTCASEEGKQGDAVRVPLSQAELGRATGLSRETINRLLRGWAERGVVALEKACVSIVEKEVLREHIGPALCRGLIDDR